MVLLIILIAIIVFALVSCMTYINPNERGLLVKKFGKSLPPNEIIAFNGEAGYQGNLLQPGFHIVIKLMYDLIKVPLVQTTANGGGIIISQIGTDIPKGSINATGKEITLDHYKDPRKFLEAGGQKGIQRLMLPVSTTIEIHPVAFLVKTTNQEIYGIPLTEGDKNELVRMNPALTTITGGN